MDIKDNIKVDISLQNITFNKIRKGDKKKLMIRLG